MINNQRLTRQYSAVVLILLVVNTAAAQDFKWEIEAHGGVGIPQRVKAGAAIGPLPQGGSFTTIRGFPSRHVPSWFFGDGALLLNEVLGALGRTERITTLDPMFTMPLIQRKNGKTYGVRLSRRFKPRFSAEITVDRGLRGVESSSARSAIEATSATFGPAWDAVITSLQPRETSKSWVNKSIKTGDNQFLTMATVNFDLTRNRRLRPYVAGGAGLASTSSGPPTADLQGNYGFRPNFVSPNPILPYPIAENDHLTIRYPHKDLLLVVGGGVKYHVSDRWGFRADTRLLLNKLKVTVTAIGVTATVAPNFPLITSTNDTASTPSIQFSNMGGTPNLIVPESSLGPSGLFFIQTFGIGTEKQAHATIGIFWRF